MSAFLTLLAAETRARELVESGHFLTAVSEVVGAAYVVRGLRPMSTTGLNADGLNAAGSWDRLSDDAAS